MGHRLIDVMIKNNVPVLYINNNAYVTEDTINNNSIIRKMVSSAAEVFSYDYLATYCKENSSKKIADNMFAGKYVVRFANADKCGNESVYSA